MKVLFHSLFILLFVFTACTSTPKQATIDYTQYVNPFIGTDFTGNTYPGAQVPFGMVQLSPDNGLPGWDRISGYFYPDSTIAGFSHTHLSGTGAGDLYDISFMPVTLPYKEAEAPLGIYSKFSHQDESATAGYYQVLLKDYGINVELTATERCGIQRYTFPEAKAAIFLNLKKAMNWDFTNDSHIEVIDSVTIQGYRFSDGLKLSSSTEPAHVIPLALAFSSLYILYILYDGRSVLSGQMPQEDALASPLRHSEA